MRTEGSSRGLWLTYLVYLTGSLVVFEWFDRTALSALSSPGRDEAGNLVFIAGGAAVYPFTVVAAAVGVSLSAYSVWRKVGDLWGLVLGLLVGRASVLALFELYEITFVGLGTVFRGWRAWGENYGAGLEWTLLKTSYVATVAPFASRRGALVAVAALSAALVLFLVWVLADYRLPQSGDALGYALNAATRVLYGVAPSLALREWRY